MINIQDLEKGIYILVKEMDSDELIHAVKWNGSGSVEKLETSVMRKMDLDKYYTCIYTVM